MRVIHLALAFAICERLDLLNAMVDQAAGPTAQLHLVQQPLVFEASDLRDANVQRKGRLAAFIQ
jgi:hypothetical protein